MKIVIDVMGGDYVLKVVVLGVMKVIKEYFDLYIMLVGKEEEIC